MFGGLVNYAHYTGDKSYDETVSRAILSQASSTLDFMMLATQSFDLGNDDMLFWTLTALNAAEYNYHVPAGQPSDIYFQLSKNVFNLMVSRWNTTTCNGGLKWQFIPANKGFFYKSTITNSAFFQVAARLGRMTGNQTYLDWANKAYDWMNSVNYIDSNYFVFDGAGDAGTQNCAMVNKVEWSYNVGSTLAGAAYMWNATSDPIWKTRTHGFLNAVKIHFVQPFPNSTNILYERSCEAGLCGNDQMSFKAYLAQSLGKAAVVLPEIMPDVSTILKNSARAAAKTCTGGATGRFCGVRWWIGGWDGTEGVGQQMTAFETISSLLAWTVGAPVKRTDSSSPAPVSTSTSTTTTPKPTHSSTSVSSSKPTSSTSTSKSIVRSSSTASRSASATPNSQKQGNGEVGFLAHPGMPLKNCLCMPAK